MLPSLALPDVGWRDRSPCFMAVSCVVVIVAQSAATSRAFAARARERVDEDADLLGLSAERGGRGSAGPSWSTAARRTAMADGAGARSQLAQIVFVGVVIGVLLALTGALEYLPAACFERATLTVAVGMIDVAALRNVLRESPASSSSRSSLRRR